MIYSLPSAVDTYPPGQ